MIYIDVLRMYYAPLTNIISILHSLQIFKQTFTEKEDSIFFCSIVVHQEKPGKFLFETNYFNIFCGG